jgi:hypothetical protein
VKINVRLADGAMVQLQLEDGEQLWPIEKEGVVEVYGRNEGRGNRNRILGVFAVHALAAIVVVDE